MDYELAHLHAHGHVPACRFEILAQLGQLLMEGGYGLSKDYQAAAEHFTAAAEEAEAALKPKVRHRERAMHCMCSWWSCCRRSARAGRGGSGSMAALF